MRTRCSQTCEPCEAFSDHSFASLDEYAAAGAAAATLALQEALASGAEGRIPIAGAAIHRGDDGKLTVITTGCNGRIPLDCGAGYPSDHGETSAIRNIKDFAAVDWSRTVFATTLSPCVMCTRTLMHLHGLGLRRIVIIESKSFSGGNKRLAALPGMRLVELSNPQAVRMMGRFSTRYPWDWAADIGEIPPMGTDVADPAPTLAMLAKHAHGAAVVAPDGTVVATASDDRWASGGNPVESACMRAIGLAGSAVNIREHSIVVYTGGVKSVVDVGTFGSSSLGVCELFRPRAVIFDAQVAPELDAALTAVGINIQPIPAQPCVAPPPSKRQCV